MRVGSGWFEITNTDSQKEREALREEEGEITPEEEYNKGKRNEEVKRRKKIEERINNLQAVRLKDRQPVIVLDAI